MEDASNYEAEPNQLFFLYLMKTYENQQEGGETIKVKRNIISKLSTGKIRVYNATISETILNQLFFLNCTKTQGRQQGGETINRRTRITSKLFTLA